MSNLYRYFDVKGLEATIKTESLRISKAYMLNDPFDLNPEVKIAEVSASDLRIIYRDNQYTADVNYEKMSDAELKNHWLSWCKNKFDPSTAIEELAKKIGVICFSKKHDDPLLWAHYAQKHFGASIGFCREKSPFVDMELRNILVDVDYMRKPSIVYHHPLKLSDAEKQLLDAMQTKCDIWEYEEEVRAILPTTDLNGIEQRFFISDDGHYHLKIRPNEWDEIRFGVRTEESVIRNIMSLAKEKSMLSCKFYKASLEKSTFSLKFELLN